MKSLQHQLSVTLGISVALVFIAFWWIAISTIHSVADNYVISRLEHDSEAITKSLHLNKQQWTLNADKIEPIYDKPYSGHYYVVKIGKQIFHSASQASLSIYLQPVPSKNKTKIYTYETQGMAQNTSAHNSKLLVYVSQQTLQGQPLTIYVAEDHSPIEESLQRFDWLFGLLSILTLAILFLLQKWILKRTFKQLTPLEKQLQSLELSVQQSINAEAYPVEVSSLILALNQAIQLANKQFSQARRSNANLSHALKTPLNIAFQLLPQLRQETDAAKQAIMTQQIEQQLQQIHQLIERALKKARIAQGTGINTPFNFTEDLTTLISSLQQLHAPKHIDMQILLPAKTAPKLSLLLDKEDGFELFGNLLDNAFKWCKSACKITLEQNNQTTLITIEDDGPGVDDKAIQYIRQRGFRADENIPGHGLGLSIVEDLVDAYQGSLQFQHNTPNGLKIILSFPTIQKKPA